MSRTWILTGSPAQYAAGRAHDFAVIAAREPSRDWALPNGMTAAVVASV